MAVKGQEPRPSWICRDAFERARFTDLNARLVRVNTRVLVVVALLIAIALPTIGNPVALLPSAAGHRLLRRRPAPGGVLRSARSCGSSPRCSARRR
jgi:hypothetical protein